MKRSHALPGWLNSVLATTACGFQRHFSHQTCAQCPSAQVSRSNSTNWNDLQLKYRVGAFVDHCRLGLIRRTFEMSISWMEYSRFGTNYLATVFGVRNLAERLREL
jgi:hypothetical protein